MTLLKLRLAAKKAWLWAKKFWWVLVLGLGFIVVALVGALTRNGKYLNGIINLIESKQKAHDQEMETLADIHNTEVREKNLRLEEHLKRKASLEEEFIKSGRKLDKKKEAELKRLVDASYNDPEKLAREIAEAFGLENG